MSTSNTEGFLRKYRIESPDSSSLAVFHAEPVILIPGERFTFSNIACDLIRDLMGDNGCTVNLYIKKLACDPTAPYHSIIFFFDGSFHLAEHIWAVRSSIEEIAMFNLTMPLQDDFSGKPVSGLFIADVEILTDLAQRSPFLGQLLPIADGPPDDSVWVYFLGKAESEEQVAHECTNLPMKRDCFVD